jgi:hypothetical protein
LSLALVFLASSEQLFRVKSNQSENLFSMQQAAVIIGVSETASNKLQKLQAAISSARRMEKWAQAQGFKHIVVLADETGPLEIKQVKDAINELAKKGTIDQLFVYFSGHGVNNHYSEYWLLSGAPADPQEAVNVTGSMDLAEQSVFSHVVFISDACRTAAEDTQMQRVSGSGIFPNNPPAGAPKYVDIFYATVLGDPALEIKGADKKYQALYTEVLAKGLSCDVDECLTAVQMAGKQFALVKPWPLRRYLEAAVPKRLVAAAVSPTLSQLPTAKICSPPETWLARKRLDGGSAAGPLPAQPTEPPPDTVSPLMAPRLTGHEARSRGFIGALEEKNLAEGQLTRALPQSASVQLMAEAAARAMPFGRTKFESRCGFKVQGDQLVDSYHPSVLTELDGTDSARVFALHPISVVLTFSEGRGMILPAIPEFIAGLTFEDGNLINVVYEPAENSPRWGQYQRKADTLRKLRGKIAAATRHGIFQPTGEGINELARQMQISKGYDPTMALYAAYAYHGIRQRERIVEMEEFLFQDLHLRFFDLALLAGTIHERPNRKILPATPLLSQGWALLPARQVTLPPALKNLRDTLTNSLWSTFTKKGVQMLTTALKSGEIPQ